MTIRINPDIQPAATPRLPVDETRAAAFTEAERLLDLKATPAAVPAAAPPPIPFMYLMESPRTKSVICHSTENSLSLSPALARLQKSQELCYIISPDEAIFYDPASNSIRLLLGHKQVGGNREKELIYAPDPSSHPSDTFTDPAAVWEKINSKESIEINLRVHTNWKGFLTSVVSIKSKNSSGLDFRFTSTSIEDPLIAGITGLEKLIDYGDKHMKSLGKTVQISYPNRLVSELTLFLRNLQTAEDPENTLDRILPSIKTPDLLILFKYLHKTDMGLIADKAFRKVAEHLKPNLSEIENLVPFFQHPVNEEQWPQLINKLVCIVTGGLEAIPKPLLKSASNELLVLLFLALERAVKSKNTKAISFLLTNFPFLKHPKIAEEECLEVHYTDSKGIHQIHTFHNPFYSALTSLDGVSPSVVKSFLNAGYSLKGKAGAKIIKKLLSVSRFSTDPYKRALLRVTLLDLLQYGLDPEFIIDGPSGLPATIAETLFLHDNPELHEFGLKLFQDGKAKITSRIEETMKLDLPEHLEYGAVLIKAGKATADLICYLRSPLFPDDGRDSYIFEMSNYKRELDILHRRYTANPFIEDFTTLERIRRIKKEAKIHINTHPQDREFKELYKSFSSPYDTLVTNHYLLAQLKQISQELRAYVTTSCAIGSASSCGFSDVPPALSNRVVALFSLWHPTAGPVKEVAIQVINSLTPTSRRAHWKIVRDNLLQATADVNCRKFWRGKYVTCFHGTKLSPGMCKERALLPAGMMLKDRSAAIVQFTGERWGTNNRLNKEHTSSVRPAQSWSDLDVKYRLLSATTPMLIAKIYATQITGCANSETSFDYEASRKRVEWNYIANAVFSGSTRLSNLQQCCTDILRLRAWDPSYKTYLQPLSNTLGAEIEQAVNESLSADPEMFEIYGKRVRILQELLDALIAPIKHPLDASDKELLEHPIPVVFASTNISPISVKEVLSPQETNGKHYDEVLIPGKSDFGKDMQVAFVNNDDVERASRILSPLDLAVYPLRIAHAIETESMIRGAHMLERHKASLTAFGVTSGGSGASGTEDLKNHQASLAVMLQERILPSYGRPLCEFPMYIDHLGRKHLVERPFWGREFPTYSAYRQALLETAAIPRSIHGKMHAVRTAIAAQLWANFYSLIKENTIAPDRWLLVLAAAAHDAQREDEGEDHWDKASGSAFYSYLASINEPKATCELYGHALTEKDPSERDPTTGRPIFTSDEQRIIHDADVLEIMRVLRDKKHFRISELAALELSKKYDEEAIAKIPKGIPESALQRLSNHNVKDLNKIVKEWGDFIDITENPKLKMYLEYTPSLDYYTEVMKILRYLVDKRQLDTLAMYLAGELAQINLEPSCEVKRFLG